MTDEEFKREAEDLVEMLSSLRRIRDKGLRKWLKTEIRWQVMKLTRD